MYRKMSNERGMDLNSGGEAQIYCIVLFRSRFNQLILHRYSARPGVI